MSMSNNSEKKKQDIENQDIEINKDNEPSTEELKKEIKELNDKFLRAKAETENLRRRYINQIEETAEYAIFDFAKALIGIMDNFDRAIENYSQDNTIEDLKNIIEGIKLTQNDLLKMFDKYKITAIKPKVGDNFDYNIHHAIAKEETDKYNSGSVISIMQIGYQLKKRLLRPCLVTISSKKE